MNQHKKNYSKLNYKLQRPSFVKRSKYYYQNYNDKKYLFNNLTYIYIIKIQHNIKKMQSEGTTDTGFDTLQFKADTDTFSIVVEFSNSKISIELKDYVNWIIYAKDYTEEDIGKEIHRKIDLIDIYKAFAMTQTSNQVSGNSLVRYKMGTVVKAKGLPCYKIQPKGVITTYRNVFERSATEKSDENLQQLTYNSVLQLSKVRDMEKMEQFAVTSDIHRKQLTENFVDKMVKIQEEKKSLQIKCDNLQNKLAHLQQEHRENWLKCKNEHIQQRSNLEKQIKHFSQKHEALEGKLIHSLQQFKDSLKNLKAQQIEQTKKREQETKLLYDAIAQAKKQQAISKNQSELALSLLQYSKYYKIAGPNFNMEYLGADGTWQQILINHQISHNTIYTYCVKLVKSPSKNIILGIADLNKAKSAQHSHGSEHAVMYYCNNGYRYPNMEVEGAVAQGEILNVVVNLQQGTIKIIVGEETRATLKHDMLAQSGRILVPCLEMYNTGDIVQWIV